MEDTKFAYILERIASLALESSNNLTNEYMRARCTLQHHRTSFCSNANSLATITAVYEGWGNMNASVTLNEHFYSRTRDYTLLFRSVGWSVPL